METQKVDDDDTKKYFHLIRKLISEVKEADSKLERNIKLDALTALTRQMEHKILNKEFSKSETGTSDFIKTEKADG